LGLALPSTQREQWAAALSIARLTLTYVHAHGLDASFPRAAVACPNHHLSLAATEHDGEHRPRWPHHEKGHDGHDSDLDLDPDVPTETPTTTLPYADSTATAASSRTALAQ